MAFSHRLQFCIPFESERQSTIAANSLSPDPMLRPEELTVDYHTDGPQLHITFEGASDRIIRVAANNVMENLKTVIECFEDFAMVERTTE